MLIKLMHPLDTHDLWVDVNEIVVMERKKKIKSSIIQPDDEVPEITVVVLKMGKTITCLESCEEIMELVKKNQSANLCNCVK